MKESNAVIHLDFWVIFPTSVIIDYIVWWRFHKESKDLGFSPSSASDWLCGFREVICTHI